MCRKSSFSQKVKVKIWVWKFLRQCQVTRIDLKCFLFKVWLDFNKISKKFISYDLIFTNFLNISNILTQNESNLPIINNKLLLWHEVLLLTLPVFYMACWLASVSIKSLNHSITWCNPLPLDASKSCTILQEFHVLKRFVQKFKEDS